MFWWRSTTTGAKEWCWNEDDRGRRSLRGTAWNESEYRFTFNDAALPWDRDPTHGFRCVRTLPDDDLTELTVRPVRKPVWKYANVERQPIESLRKWYQYDHLPLDAEQLPTHDSRPFPDFRHEHIRVDAAYFDGQLDIHLFVTRTKQEKYETVVWVSGMGQWQSEKEFAVGEYASLPEADISREAP